MPAPAVPDEVLGAARAALGPDGEALAFGDFPAAGGRQVLAVQRLTGTTPRAQSSETSNSAAGASSGAFGSAAATPSNTAETTVIVIRVSILGREGNHWTEAFRADEHLKNGKGYLAGAPGVSVPAWRMTYQKTADGGFGLEFVPLDLPPEAKAAAVKVAWNAKSRQYEALDTSGKRFLGTKTSQIPLDLR